MMNGDGEMRRQIEVIYCAECRQENQMLYKVDIATNCDPHFTTHEFCSYACLTNKLRRHISDVEVGDVTFAIQKLSSDDENYSHV